MKRKNIEPVAYSSTNYFLNGMRGHSAVQSITSLGNDKYLIARTNGRDPLTIMVADIYIAGEADLYELSDQIQGVDALILIGFYNRYSSAAKTLAKNMGVGLFTNREFWGAVNLSGDKFMDYVPKGDD